MKYFEEINLKNLEDYYSNEIEIDSKVISIDLNFETKKLKNAEAHKLNACLENISDVIADSRQWILEDYKSGENVKEYISFHMDELFEDDIKELLKGTDESLDNKDRFLQTLRLKRIGIYPDSSDHYMIIDWMTNPDISNYILVVVVNEDFELEHLTIES